MILNYGKKVSQPVILLPKNVSICVSEKIEIFFIIIFILDGQKFTSFSEISLKIFA